MDQVQSQSAVIAKPSLPTGMTQAAYTKIDKAVEKFVTDGMKGIAPKPENTAERVIIATLISHYRSIGQVSAEDAAALIAASHKGRYELPISERGPVTITHATAVSDEVSKRDDNKWGEREFQRLKVSYKNKSYRVYHSGFKKGTEGAKKFPGLAFTEVTNQAIVDAQLIETLLQSSDGTWRIVATLRVFGINSGDGIEWIELQPVQAASNGSLSFEIE